MNNYGQLGVGDNENHSEPTEVSVVSGADVLDVQAGEHHSMILTTDGCVYVMGRADQGQLGIVGKPGDKIPVGQCITEPKLVHPSRLGGAGMCPLP